MTTRVSMDRNARTAAAVTVKTRIVFETEIIQFVRGEFQCLTSF